MRKEQNDSVISYSSLSFWELPTCCFLTALGCTLMMSNSHQFGSFGTNDFIEYWSAFQIAQSGGNPYNAQEMLEFQKSINPTCTTPLMMWNPPWLLVIMFPLLKLSFAKASIFWLALNIFFIAASIRLIHSTLLKNISIVPLFLLAATLLPIANALLVGQVSLLLLFACSLMLVALRNKDFLLVGICCTLLSVKPHLSYLFVLTALWCSLQNSKNFRQFLIGVFSSCGLLLLLTAGLSSNLLTNYFEISFNQTGVTAVSSWLPAVPLYYLRLFLGAAYPTTLNVLLPICIATTTFAFLMIKKPAIDWNVLGPTLIIISIATTSFGWVFDLSLLLIPLLFQFHRATSSNLRLDKIIFAGMVFAMLLAIAITPLIENPQHHHYAWFTFFFLPACRFKN